MGYIGCALDMYGKGVLAHSIEEAQALKKPFIEDRYLLQRRLLKGFNAAISLPNVEAGKRAAIGFGFGGLCALDLARSGVDLQGVVSVYGHFDPPPADLIKPIQSKILVLHGYLDRIASQEELMRFEKEMDRAGVDWQVHLYGEAMHAFATPEAKRPNEGILYNPLAAQRAQISMQHFLQEIFA